MRALFQEPDVQVIAVADPAERWNLDAFYYKGDAGRKPVKAEIEKHYGEKTPNFRCAEYEDFRVMLEKEKAVDAVLCATPDHLHAYVSVLAMRSGKHVYCEKPLTHNIWEARQVAQVAKETGVATQLGNHGHSRDTIRQTCEWIWDGVIGPVREVQIWVPSGRFNRSLTGRPTDAAAMPAGLNWDLWLGPREPRPFHPAYAPVTWRDFWAFGTGTMGDFGCHDLDNSLWALDLDVPLSVRSLPGRQHGCRDCAARRDLLLRVRSPRRQAPGQNHLVRRRTAASLAEGDGPGAAVARPRGPFHRRQGKSAHRRLGGPTATAALREELPPTRSRRKPSLVPRDTTVTGSTPARVGRLPVPTSSMAPSSPNWCCWESSPCASASASPGTR